jgi:hypothetical protein
MEYNYGKTMEGNFRDVIAFQLEQSDFIGSDEPDVEDSIKKAIDIAAKDCSTLSKIKSTGMLSQGSLLQKKQ